MDEGLAKIRHARSKKDFPFLELEDNEYVEYAFSRAKVCLVMIFGGTFAGLILLLLGFLMALTQPYMIGEIGKNFAYIIIACLLLADLLIGVVALVVYRGNRLFVTNKHVIQLLMKSPVATSVNVIDLPSIEDVSFHQDGLMQRALRYGTFRLSTIGDETTYTFSYSDIAPEDLRAVSKIITEAKARAKREKN